MRAHATLAASTLLIVVLAATVRHGSSLECYKCNSEFDPRCGDPFDPYSLGMVNCSYQPHLEHLPPELEPTLCRKTKQIVSGKTRVIRDCGLVTDEATDDKACMQRIGTFEVKVLYCSCTTDLCNGASTPNSYGHLILVFAFLGVGLAQLANPRTP